MKSFYKRILVTGGYGFIGSHLVDFLLAEGHHVTVVDNLSTGLLSNLKKWEGDDNFHFVNADICKPRSLQGVFSHIDWVFHLAALSSVTKSLEEPSKYFKTNVEGTYNVLKAAHLAGVKRFLYAASSSCYGVVEQYPIPETAPIKPASTYALTKYFGEKLVLHWAQTYRLPALSLRLFNVFGPRLNKEGSYASVFGTFLKQKMRRQPLTIVGDGNQTRDFIYVSDVVDAFYSAAKSPFSNDVINVGSSSSYSINFLAKLMECPTIYIPERPGEVRYSLANVEKIYNKLSWKAKISFKEGVRRLLEEELSSSLAGNHTIGIEKLIYNDLLSADLLPA